MRKNRLLYWMLISLLSFATITGCNSKEGSKGVSTQAVEQEDAKNLAQELAELDYQAKTLLIQNEGREIPCVLTLPNAEGKIPLIVMTHGFAGNKDEGGGFVKISETLANEGFATLRMDFAGCGDSSSDFTDFNLDNNKSDVKACLQYVLENENIDQQKIGIFGYSMGGALAVLLSDEENSPYQAMALLAPGTPINKERVSETKQMIKKAQDTGYTSIDWFGNKINVGIDYYKGLLNAFDTFRNYNNTCDTIVIYGDEDKIVLPEYSKAFADQMGVESVLINGADHGYGFYSEQPEVTEKLLDTVSEFFDKELHKAQEEEIKGDIMAVEKKGTLKYTEMVLKIDAKDHKIPATVCIPGGEGLHPAIVMLHGTGSNRNEVGNGYQIAAKELAEKYGLATIRIDFMGNGDSTELYEDYNFTTAVNDAMSAINYIKGVDTIDAEKIGIMGWSQGGSIAMLTASKYGNQIKSIATWAGATDLTGLFNDKEYNEAKENGYFVREYDWREPLHFGLQWCNDTKNTNILKEFAKYTGPVLAIAGSKDDVVSPDCAKEIVATSQSKNSKTYVIKGMDHTFNVFSETDQASLYKAIEKTGQFFEQTLN